MSAAAVLPFEEVADSTNAPNPRDDQEAVRRRIPSLRNREVFAAVAAGKTHAEAAEEFGLTQPRVTQIVRQVREWCSQVNRGDGSDLSEMGRLQLAQYTLEVQFDGWMQMVMKEWRKSCREGVGRPAFVNAAMRIGSNKARLHGVDISGKTARLRAEQQAREMREQRMQATAADKPLWEESRETPAAATPEARKAVPTLAPDTVCEERHRAAPSPSPHSAVRKNSYETVDLPTPAEVVASIKNRLVCATPAAAIARQDKPVPKFLDKKVRKRLLALRRQEARAAALGAVG